MIEPVIVAVHVHGNAPLIVADTVVDPSPVKLDAQGRLSDASSSSPTRPAAICEISPRTACLVGMDDLRDLSGRAVRLVASLAIAWGVMIRTCHWVGRLRIEHADTGQKGLGIAACALFVSCICFAMCMAALRWHANARTSPIAPARVSRRASSARRRPSPRAYRRGAR